MHLGKPIEQESTRRELIAGWRRFDRGGNDVKTLFRRQIYRQIGKRVVRGYWPPADGGADR